MRRFPIEWLIVAICAVGLIVGWRVYGAGEMGRFGPVIHAQRAPSKLYARLVITYAKPPIEQERYDMSDSEGVSTFQYAISGSQGHIITVKAPAARVYDVSFFFGRLVQDGVWQLDDKAPLPSAPERYAVYVRQAVDYKQGDRLVTFTSPQYWATKTGRQYQIDLSKGVPSDLLHIASSDVKDPRYEQIVKDFRDFGPDVFRHNVAAAQQQIRRSGG
jgi:hypothetical protein